MAASGQQARPAPISPARLTRQQEADARNCFVSLVCLALGDRDAQYAWLEKSYDDRAEWLLWLTVDPVYDGERDDPRFQNMTRTVGL